MNLRKTLHWFRQTISYLFWPALLLIIWGQLAPLVLTEDIGNSDKLLHFIAYFGLSLMATIAVRADRRTLWCIAGLIALGGSMEIIQGMVGRDADLADEIANTLGVVLGAALAWAGIGVLKARKLVERTKPD